MSIADPNLSGTHSDDEFIHLRIPVDTDANHRLPFAVGLSVGYRLGNRWSITSGVTYTLLSSRFVVRSGDDHDSWKQTLHNIGIPLSVNYDIWSGKRLSVYLSAGGQVEKSVSGSVTERRVTGGIGGPERRESISDRVQLSVRGSVGVQYDFAKIVGLYAEPGVNYYFDNGSSIETIYKARPLNFGFQMGLRFSL